MADITNIKIGNNNPKAIMFADVITPKADILFSTDNYHPYATDGGGYWVHGLWLAPYGPWGVYSWPWDLNIPSGALKDMGNAVHWGYVKDGVRKNITKGLKTSFPANVSGNQRICISLWSNNPNYTDEDGNSFIDFGDIPVVITFLDDRFDNYTWVGNTGAVYEWSEDKRTITIHRVPASADYQHLSWVCRSEIDDVSIERVRADLTDVYANVTGLTAHYDGTVPIDPTTVECWDVYVGDKHIYHKDKTIANAWDKYGMFGDSYKESGKYDPDSSWKVTYYDTVNKKVYNNTEYSTIKIPLLADFNAQMALYHQLEVIDDTRYTKSIKWNCQPTNLEFWRPVKEWYANNTITHLVSLFYNSNIEGSLTLNLPTEEDTNSTQICRFFSGEKAFYGTYLTDITINIPYLNSLTSGNTLFQGATTLKKVTVNVATGEHWHVFDCSGMFEYCNNLEALPDNMWIATNQEVDYGDSYSNQLMGWFVEYCMKITTIPCNNNNVFVPRIATQMCNGASALVTIEPVIDCKVLDPRMADKMFGGTDSLTSVKLKNLNHGDWIFDNVARTITIGGEASSSTICHGNLTKLDTESVEYLFANLVDLTSNYDNLAPVDADSVTASSKSSTAKLYCPSVWFGAGGEYFDFTTMTVGSGSPIVTANSVIMASRMGTSDSSATLYLSGDQDTTIKIQVSGLQEGDVLGIGGGAYSAIPNKVTEDGVYTFSFTSTWGFKLWNTIDTSITSAITVTSLSLSGEELKVTDQMVADANAKGWTVYNGGVAV